MIIIEDFILTDLLEREDRSRSCLICGDGVGVGRCMDVDVDG